MERLKASVQYDDWQGTAAADDADMASISSLLRDRGDLGDSSLLVAVELWIGENHGGRVVAPNIKALILDNAEDREAVLAALDAPGPLRLRSVDVEVSLQEFLGLFKRFAVTLTASGLKVGGREFERQSVR